MYSLLARVIIPIMFPVPSTYPRLFLVAVILLTSSLNAGIKGVDPIVIDGVPFAIGGDIDLSGPFEPKDAMDLSRGDATIRAVRFGTRANQDAILVYLNAPPAALGTAHGKALDNRMTKGTWWHVKGRLVDANPTGLSPAISVIVERLDPIEPALLGLGDWIDREAQLDATADAAGLARIDGQLLALDGLTAWPPNAVGKRITLSGVVRRYNERFRLEHPSWRLVDLADQLGNDVILEGALWSLNDHWWFGYHGDRENRLYLTDARDHTFVGKSDDHGRRVRVSGKLVRQDRPSLEQISLKTDRDLVPTYVIRRAKVEYLDEARGRGQLFRQLYAQPNTIVDGVPLLVPEVGLQRNIMGYETDAMYYRGRNARAIETILSNRTAAKLDVVARRMNDPELKGALRLLYAAVLAAANDARGRDVLVAASRVQNDDIGSALYCLTDFAYLAPRAGALKTEIGWAEAPLIAVLQQQDDKGKHALADRAIQVSNIVELVLSIDTPAGHTALLDLAMSPEGWELELPQKLCRSGVLLPIADLQRLEGAFAAAAARDRAARDAEAGNAAAPAKGQVDMALMGFSEDARRSLCRQWLLHDHPAAVERFGKELEDGFVYMDFRTHLSRPIVAALRANRDRLSDAARTHVDLLLILAGNDPVATLLQLLDDPKWSDKNIIFWELARLADPRAVAPAARLLRNAPRDYFGDKSASTYGVEHALEAIANAGSKDSTLALIELFDVDLSRFGTHHDADGFRRLIAAHLINTTGESHGVDAAAWQRWYRDAAK